MRSETERPRRFASAAKRRCSARVIRKLSITERRSDSGFGGLPISFVIGDTVLHKVLPVNKIHFPSLRSQSQTSGHENRRYRPIRKQGSGVPLCFPRRRDFS
jgi:hypothetical protein